MDEIKTDETIAYIFNRLKDLKNKDTKSLVTPSDNADPEKVIEDKGDPFGVLPWFSKSDRDIQNIHYMAYTSDGTLVHKSTDARKDVAKIASMKLSDDYVCDVNYYLSKHFVLYVGESDSNYNETRVYTPEGEELVVEDVSIVNESLGQAPEFTKTHVDNLKDCVNQKYTMRHYMVFTDLGVADFVARAEDIPYRLGDTNLNKWFEEVSNYNRLYNPDYSRCPLESDSPIRDLCYDIITMHRPGIITLDSVDNHDSDYCVHLKVKESFSFIPMDRLLLCLKHYSRDGKSVDDLRRFIHMYFDII